jgi:hypothetical protein
MGRALVRSLCLVAWAGCAAAPAAAQNQSVNPGFVTDLGGWTVGTHPAVTAAHDTSQSFNSPGSLRVSTAGSTPANLIGVGQCLPVTPGQVLDFGGRYRFESGHAANLKGFALAVWFSDGACSAGTTFGPASNVIADVPDTWLPVHADDVPVPAGFGSALFLLVVAMATGEGVGWFDDVYFGPAPLVPVELLGLTVE